MALKYYVAGSGGTNNFGTTGAGSNWSLSDGGPGGQTPPTVADDIQITSNSPTLLIIDTTARACKSILTKVDWTGTIQMDVALSVSGSISLNSGTTVTGTGKLEALVAAGHYIAPRVPVLGFRGAVTHTFLDIVRCGTLFIGSTTNATILNTNWIEIDGDLDLSLNTTAILSGTTVLKMVGTGQIKYPTSTGVLRNSLTIVSGANVTFATGTFRYNTGLLTAESGATVSASGCDLVITASTTLDTNGATCVFGTLNISGTSTIGLNSNLHVSGLTQLGGTTLTTTFTGADIHAKGGLTINGTTAVLTGDAAIVLAGTGTFTCNTTTSIHALDIYIDAVAGTVTTAGTIRYPFNRFKYVSGTVVTAAGTWSTAGGGSGGAFTFVG